MLLLLFASGGCEYIVGIPQVTLSPCPAAGSEMVLVPDADQGDFCIDSTEVDNEQFNQYLVASGALIAPPTECYTATAGQPLADSTPSDANLPVANIGACWAWSYCRWAGKRLCGERGGGGVARDSNTEWWFACANGRKNLAFPYGATYAATVCNTESGHLVPVGSMPGCHGTVSPFDRIFDLSGNVSEYINFFGSGVNGVIAGGFFKDGVDNPDNERCVSAVEAQGLSGSADYIGFRCCATPATSSAN
jgi:formylglycine-generating enzyme required for sulfatase activity